LFINQDEDKDDDKVPANEAMKEKKIIDQGHL